MNPPIFCVVATMANNSCQTLISIAILFTEPICRPGASYVLPLSSASAGEHARLISSIGAAMGPLVAYEPKRESKLIGGCFSRTDLVCSEVATILTGVLG